MSLGISPLLLTKQQRKLIIENFVIEKASAKLTIQTHIFLLHAPVLCNWHFWGSFQRKYVCASKISRFLVNCQNAFFSFTANRITSKRMGVGHKGWEGGDIQPEFIRYVDHFFLGSYPCISVGWVAEARTFYPSSINKEILSSKLWEWLQ